MLKAAINTGGAKIDGALAAGAIGTGVAVPDSFFQTHGANAMLALGLVLLVIRIAISSLRFWKEWRNRKD